MLGSEEGGKLVDPSPAMVHWPRVPQLLLHVCFSNRLAGCYTSRAQHHDPWVVQDPGLLLSSHSRAEERLPRQLLPLFVLYRV